MKFSHFRYFTMGATLPYANIVNFCDPEYQKGVSAVNETH